MKKLYSIGLFIISLSILVAFFSSCKNTVTQSLWDPSKQGRPQPTIDNIDPSDGALAGVTVMMIKGQNFSADAGENFVWFNEQQGTVVSATATELHVKPPNIVGDSIKVKIAVHGAELFSNIVIYKLEYSVMEYGEIDKFSDAYGLACDVQDNIYVSQGNLAIVKITPDQEKTDYVTAAPGFFKAMKMGPGGELYAARTRFVYKGPAGGGSISQFSARLGQSVNDIDFDENGNIFVAAKYGIYCVKPDGSNLQSASYPDMILNAIRIFNGCVYVAGDYSGADAGIAKKAIWRNKINSTEGELGANELAFDWETFSGAVDANILSITFAEDGDLLIGADDGDAVTMVHPNPDGNYLNGSSEALYPEVLVPPATYMVWGTGKYLYVNRKSTDLEMQRLLRITMRKKSAPYYGRK